MNRETLRSALDGAELVKVRNLGAFDVVQVWHGGTQVTVLSYEEIEGFEEETVWNISDEKGRPVEQETIRDQMMMHFDLYEEEYGGEF